MSSRKERGQVGEGPECDSPSHSHSNHQFSKDTIPIEIPLALLVAVPIRWEGVPTCVLVYFLQGFPVVRTLYYRLVSLHLAPNIISTQIVSGIPLFEYNLSVGYTIFII